MVLGGDVVEESLAFLREKIVEYGERLPLSYDSYGLRVMVSSLDCWIIFMGAGGRLDLADCLARRGRYYSFVDLIGKFCSESH